MSELDNQECALARERLELHELDLEHRPLADVIESEQHFESCKPCVNWRKQWELSKIALRSMPELEVPGDVFQGVMSRIDSVPSATIGRGDILLLAASLSLFFASLSTSATTGLADVAAWMVSLVIFVIGHHMMSQRTPLSYADQ